MKYLKIFNILKSLIGLFFINDKIKRQAAFIDRYYNYRGKIKNSKVRFLGKTIFTPWLPMLRAQLRAFFIEEEYKFDLGDNPIIIDGGSNIGLAIIYYHLTFNNPKIIALEADSSIVNNYLEKNIKAFDIKNVEIINKGLWSSEGELNFVKTGLDSGKISASGKHTIQTITLDSIIEKYDNIDFLKLDIEGAALEVLNASKLLHKVKYMYVELEMNTNLDDILETLKLLKKNKFKYFIRSTTKEMTPDEIFDSNEELTYYTHIFAKQIND